MTLHRLLIASVASFAICKYLSFELAEKLVHSRTFEPLIDAGSTFLMTPLNVVATLAAFFVARCVELRIVGDDRRPHAFLIVFTGAMAVMMLIMVRPAPLSVPFFAQMGTFLACVIEWLITKPSFMPAFARQVR